MQSRKVSWVNKSHVRYSPRFKSSTSSCFCSSVLNHLCVSTSACWMLSAD